MLPLTPKLNTLSHPFVEGEVPMVLVLGMVVEEALSWMCSERTGWAQFSHAIFLSMCVLNTFVFQYFSVSSFGNSCHQEWK